MHTCTYIVKQMLMSKSQLQPVIMAAAAGGKRMAIYRTKSTVSLPSFRAEDRGLHSRVSSRCRSHEQPLREREVREVSGEVDG